MTFEEELKETISNFIVDLDEMDINAIVTLKNKYCLDKQKVKDVIKQLIFDKHRICDKECEHKEDLLILLKELGLDEK